MLIRQVRAVTREGQEERWPQAQAQCVLGRRIEK